MNRKRPFFVCFDLLRCRADTGDKWFCENCRAAESGSWVLGTDVTRTASWPISVFVPSLLFLNSFPAEEFVLLVPLLPEGISQTGKANQPEGSFSRTLPLLSRHGQNSCRTVTSVLWRHCDRRGDPLSSTRYDVVRARKELNPGEKLGSPSVAWGKLQPPLPKSSATHS